MRIRLVLLLLALLGGFQIGAASPARACSCVSNPDETQYAEWADAIFVGDVVGYAPPPERAVMSSLDPAIWTFEVSAVYQGDVAAMQDVVSPVSGASCGLELPHSGTFLVYATSAWYRDDVKVGGPVLYAGLCAGTRPIAEGPVPAALGAPRPPATGVRAAVVPSPSESPMEPSPSGTPTAVAGPGPSAAPDWATVGAWSTGGLAVLVLASSVLQNRRGHRQRR